MYIVLGERNGVPIGPTVKLFYPLLNSQDFLDKSPNQIKVSMIV